MKPIFLRGYMYAGVYGDNVFVHVGEDKANSSQGKGVGFFEPMGRRMRSYITLNESAQKEKAVVDWLKIGAHHVNSLPEKLAKKRNKAKPIAKPGRADKW